MSKAERYLKEDMRILRLLFFETTPLYAAEIAKKLNLVPMTTLRKLSSLEKEGMATVDKKGRLKFYTLTEKGKELVRESLETPSTPSITKSFSPETPFVRREFMSHKPETHAAGICIRDNRGKFQVLMAKRVEKRDIFPNIFDCGGGFKEPWETWENCVSRHMYQGFGAYVNTRPFRPVLDIQIALPYDLQKKDRTFISGLALLCEFESYPHGEPRLNTEEYVEGTLDWYDVDTLDVMDVIPGLKDEITAAVKLTMAMNRLFGKRFILIEEKKRSFEGFLENKKGGNDR